MQFGKTVRLASASTARSRVALLAFCAICLGNANVMAGGNPEISVTILGRGVLERGKKDDSFRLPVGPNGPLKQAMVLLASQPLMPEGETGPIAPEIAAEGRMVPVPATIRFTIGGNDLPPWTLFKFPTAYIINYETLKNNPQFKEGRLTISIDTETNAESVEVEVFGMPDPFLLNETLNGPMSAFYDATTGSTQAYFKALAHEMGGEKATARAAYREIAKSSDERVARFARRGLRMLSYDIRPHKLSGNFREHYRWGLFMQQCGFPGPAQKEFNECRIIYPQHSDAQFRAAETLDQIGGSSFQVLDYVERSGEAIGERSPAGWSVLIVVERIRNGRELSAPEVFEFKANWLLAQFMIWSASGAQLAPIAASWEVRELPEDAHCTYADGIVAPCESIVGERGWFDSVIYVRPRGKDDDGPAVRTLPPDQGPKGAALATLYHDASWIDCLKAWYSHYAWACETGEISPAGVLGNDASDCGFQPGPQMGYAIRSALRYFMNPLMHRRAKISDLDVPGSYQRVWQIEGPFSVKSDAQGGEPARHVLDELPAQSENARQIISETDFIDLKKILSPAGPSLARARCWVYSPSAESARMWLGQNDGMAVWINGRLVHKGLYYSSHKFEDRNLTDTVAAWAPLEAGWNEVVAVIESWPSPRDKGWGFSMRFCDEHNQPIEGMAYLNYKPEKDLALAYRPLDAGGHFGWREVCDQFDVRLPVLGQVEMNRIAGGSEIRIDGKAGERGHVAVSMNGREASNTYRLSAWRDGQDRDVRLNNVIDWDRESVAVLRYKKDGRDRDLLFVRPEALVAYMTLLKEPPEAAELFGSRPLDQRLLGYVVVPAGNGATRVLFVLDCYLGDESTWPIDEEDLLVPIPPDYVPNPTRMLPPANLAGAMPEQDADANASAQ